MLLAIIIPAICLLVIVAGLLSSAETAITASSKAKLHVMAKGGNKKAHLAQQMQQNLGLSLSTILLFNTVCNNTVTAIITDAVTDQIGKDALIFIPFLVSFFLVIYTETLPKIIAVNSPEKILMLVIRPIWVVFRLFKPITITINYLARAHLRLFNYRTKVQDDFAGVEELRGAIDLHFSQQKAPEDERAMLRSILDLRSLDVDQIMVHRKNVVMINADDTMESIVEQVLQSPYTRIPVWRNEPENIVGILHAKELWRVIQSNHGKVEGLSIDTLLTPPWFIIETRDLIGQLQAFKSRREHMAIVVDEYGVFSGIVTLEDILEEIVGDISDEHDETIEGIHAQEDGTYIVEGTVAIRDINRKLDWELPSEEMTTLAGLLIYEVRCIPDVGQIFIVSGHRMEVLGRTRNQITSIRLFPKEESS